jgi:acyl carrier protein
MTIRQQQLRDTLAEIMKVDPNALSVIAPFWELGVDSLIALRFAGKIEDLYRTEVQLEWLFDYPTICQLALFLDDQLAGSKGKAFYPDDEKG